MEARIIVMLTNNDQTVKEAIEIFDTCKDLPIQYWGFKDIGLPVTDMKILVKNMKDSGKTACLEVVSYTENECMLAAKLAVECKFDYLMGTIFYETVYEYIKDKEIKYTPFCGIVSGSPSILEGSIEEIIEDAKRIEAYGVDGFDILAYRYVGDPLELAQRFVAEVNIPVCIAGSIDSFERIDIINNLNPWSFTMGSALFKKCFEKDGSFRENLQRVIKYMDSK